MLWTAACEWVFNEFAGIYWTSCSSYRDVNTPYLRTLLQCYRQTPLLQRCNLDSFLRVCFRWWNSAIIIAHWTRMYNQVSHFENASTSTRFPYLFYKQKISVKFEGFAFSIAITLFCCCFPEGARGVFSVIALISSGHRGHGPAAVCGPSHRVRILKGPVHAAMTRSPRGRSLRLTSHTWHAHPTRPLGARAAAHLSHMTRSSRGL